MSETRAFVAHFPSGNIRWVIERDTGEYEFMFPHHDTSLAPTSKQIEWMELWADSAGRVSRNYMRAEELWGREDDIV